MLGLNQLNRTWDSDREWISLGRDLTKNTKYKDAPMFTFRTYDWGHLGSLEKHWQHELVHYCSFRGSPQMTTYRPKWKREKIHVHWIEGRLTDTWLARGVVWPQHVSDLCAVSNNGIMESDGGQLETALGDCITWWRGTGRWHRMLRLKY